MCLLCNLCVCTAIMYIFVYVLPTGCIAHATVQNRVQPLPIHSSSGKECGSSRGGSLHNSSASTICNPAAKQASVSPVVRISSASTICNPAGGQACERHASVSPVYKSSASTNCNQSTRCASASRRSCTCFMLRAQNRRGRPQVGECAPSQTVRTD
jgi:hypothetical protein